MAKFEVGDKVIMHRNFGYDFGGDIGNGHKGLIVEITSVDEGEENDILYGVKGSYIGDKPNWRFMEDNFKLYRKRCDKLDKLKKRLLK